MRVKIGMEMCTQKYTTYHDEGGRTWREKNQWLKKGIDVQKRESMELRVG